MRTRPSSPAAIRSLRAARAARSSAAVEPVRHDHGGLPERAHLAGEWVGWRGALVRREQRPLHGLVEAPDVSLGEALRPDSVDDVRAGEIGSEHEVVNVENDDGAPRPCRLDRGGDLWQVRSPPDPEHGGTFELVRPPLELVEAENAGVEEPRRQCRGDVRHAVPVPWSVRLAREEDDARARSRRRRAPNRIELAPSRRGRVAATAGREVLPSRASARGDGRPGREHEAAWSDATRCS